MANAAAKSWRHLGDAQRLGRHLTEEFNVGVCLWMGSLDHNDLLFKEFVTVELDLLRQPLGGTVFLEKVVLASPVGLSEAIQI